MTADLKKRRVSKSELLSLERRKDIALYRSTSLGFDPFIREWEFEVQYLRLPCNLREPKS